jgi:hypothetical protein
MMETSEVSIHAKAKQESAFVHSDALSQIIKYEI